MFRYLLSVLNGNAIVDVFYVARKNGRIACKHISANLTLFKSETLKLIDTNFCTIVSLGEILDCAKNHRNWFHRGAPHICEI